MGELHWMNSTTREPAPEPTTDKPVTATMTPFDVRRGRVRGEGKEGNENPDLEQVEDDTEDDEEAAEEEDDEQGASSSLPPPSSRSLIDIDTVGTACSYKCVSAL